MLCRLCIFEFTDEEVFQINDEKEFELLKLIVKHLYLELTNENNIKVCAQCSEHLREINEFFKYIKERQQVLKDVLSNDDRLEFYQQTTIEIVESIEENPIGLNDIIPEEKLEVTEIEQTVDFEVIPDSIEFVATVDNDEVFSNEYSNFEDDSLTFETTLESQNSAEDYTTKLSTKNKKTDKFTVYKSRAQNSREQDKFIEKNAQLKCEICRDISKTFREFQTHFNDKHKSSPYIKCCGSRLYTKKEMFKHICKHVDPDRYKCQFCGKILSSPFNLRAHIGSFHTEEEKLQHACEQCGKRFSSSFVLKNHMDVHNENNKFTCEICNKTFKHSRSLQRHLRLEHGNGIHHVCELCGKSYKYKQMFEQHMADKHNVISKDTMKYCKECKCWFSTKYYNKHAEHHKLQDIECNKCGKVFPSKAALIKHRDIHYHVKKCSICGSRFEKQRQLKEHEKTHLS